jgi:phosphoribosylformimino-5-aminoimidazole carboxamide ribotide isomerase
MRFRPCIDIHNGKVKQIVGSSLVDLGDQARENFVSEQDARFYAQLYREAGLFGGHIVLLNSVSSDYYEITKGQAFQALGAYPGGLQIGGGITAENAHEFLDAGASHVIVTSYVFRDGCIAYDNLEKLTNRIDKKQIVLDLSCRYRDGAYYIVTDRWQKFTQVAVTDKVLCELSQYCDEFLVHAVDVEGKASGIETGLVKILAEHDGRAITYAGGVGSLGDLELLKKAGRNRLDVTVGSALDLFGGTIPFAEILRICGNAESNFFKKYNAYV